LRAFESVQDALEARACYVGTFEFMETAGLATYDWCEEPAVKTSKIYLRGYCNRRPEHAPASALKP
jgi:hypothetical protein